MLSQLHERNMHASKEHVHSRISWSEYFILVVAGLFGVIAVLPSAWSVFEKTAALSNVLPQLLAAGQLFQSTIWMVFTVGVGLHCATKTGLGAPILRGYLAGEHVGVKFRPHILSSVLLALFGLPP